MHVRALICMRILNLGDMPLAGGFLRSIDEAPNEKKFPLPIHVCEDCALIQIIDPVDPNILFKDYAFSSSTVGPLVSHFENYARWLKERFNPRFVVEFGCNDGILLAPLERLGIAAVGVDISENITAIGHEKGTQNRHGLFRYANGR